MQMVEVHDVIMDILHGGHEISDKLGVLRNCDAKSVFYRSYGGESMNDSADTADALRKIPGISRITVFQDKLNAPEHGA
jgi:hypothetical protein